MTRSALTAFLLPLGCLHTVDPVEAPPLPLEEDASYARGAALRIENGYEAPVLRPLRTEGIHRLQADLRQWTERLKADLEEELAERQAAVGRHGAPVLRVWLLTVAAPEATPGSGPRLTARLESGSGAFAAEYASAEGAKGFADAFFSIKRQVFDDARFREWLQRPR